MRARGVLAGLVAVLSTAGVCAAGPGAALASANRSLYTGPGPRPGPEILYAPPTIAPQLTNTGPWHAQPILVSGAEAYRDGEFLYQDYLYDDHGAHELPDPTDPRAISEGDLFSKPNGTYTYPTGPGYDNNAADLVEFRVRPLRHSTAFRITLNTLLHPIRAAFTIAIGGESAKSYALPDGANVSAPGRFFLTVHPTSGGDGMVAGLVNAATGRPVTGPAPVVHVDFSRRQIQVKVSHQDWNPQRHTVRLAAGVGLWDSATGRYLLPGAVASATAPGGAGVAAHPLRSSTSPSGLTSPCPRLRPGPRLSSTALGGATTTRARHWPRTPSRRSTPASASRSLPGALAITRRSPPAARLTASWPAISRSLRGPTTRRSADSAAQ